VCVWGGGGGGGGATIFAVYKNNYFLIVSLGAGEGQLEGKLSKLLKQISIYY
jgi:hypothetical protein